MKEQKKSAQEQKPLQKKEEEKQIQPRQSTTLKAYSTSEFSSGTEEADSSDIIIPRILLMQGTSKWVATAQFHQGDIINSVDEIKLGDKNTPVEIVPFYLKKTWEIFEDTTNGKWVRQEVWNPGNDDLPWQFEEENEEEGIIKLKRQRSYGFYSFLTCELTSGFPVPCLVNFRSSAGFKEGKKIASHFAMMKGMNHPGHNVCWTLQSIGVKEDNKAYQKFIVKKSRPAKEEEMEVCQKWLTLLANSSARFKDHQVEEKDEEVTEQTVQTKKGEVNAQAQF